MKHRERENKIGVVVMGWNGDKKVRKEVQVVTVLVKVGKRQSGRQGGRVVGWRRMRKRVMMM